MLEFFFLALLFLSQGANVQSAEEDTELQLVFVVFRHGERVPETNEQYPNDEYDIEYFRPMTYGQVTKEGKRRQYRLGEKLRSRYRKFLGDIYIPEQIVTHSTDWDRTKVSALLTLAGLFPPSAQEEWHPDLKWQPIPYEFKSSKHDHIIQRPDPYCPRYMRELNKVFASEEGQKVFKKYEKLFRYVTASSGRNITDFHELLRVFQNIRSKEFLNQTIPDWAKQIYPEPFHIAASWQCKFENYNPTLIRLNGGHMLQYFVQESARKINGSITPPGRRMFLYSGHENDIVKMLAALNVYEQHVPPYCSAVMLELHKKVSTSEYGYMIFYDNTTYTDDIYNLVMPGCTKFCEIDKFLQLTEPVRPLNYTAECESEINLD